MSTPRRFRPRVPVVSREPDGGGRAVRSLCSVCDVSDWDDPAFQSLAGRIMTGDPLCEFRHRKLWEFVRTVQALERADLWNAESLGLSVAAGHERLLFYASNIVSRIIATDVYGDGDFVQGEAREGFLQNPQAYAPYPFNAESLRPVWMNALSLEFSDGLFDFAFCLSSIEHFGGVENARRAIDEMARVVRPGGVVVVTTDCALNERTTNEVFSQAQIRELSAVSGLELMDPIDFSISPPSAAQLLDMRKDNLNVQPHINLRVFGSVFTSVSLAFRKLSGLHAPVAQRRMTLDRECSLLTESTAERRSQRPLASATRWQRMLHRIRIAGWRVAEQDALLKGELR